MIYFLRCYIALHIYLLLHAQVNRQWRQINTRERINATHTQTVSDRHTPCFESSQPVKFNGLPITNSSLAHSWGLTPHDRSTTLLPPSPRRFFAAGFHFSTQNCTLSPAHTQTTDEFRFQHTHNDCVTIQKTPIQLTFEAIHNFHLNNSSFYTFCLKLLGFVLKCNSHDRNSNGCSRMKS